MSRTVQARLDDAAEADLVVVRSSASLNDSEAIRLALREAAERRRMRDEVRREANAAGRDSRDRRVIGRVATDMDAVATDWPEDQGF